MTHQYEKLMAEARSAVWIGSDGHPTKPNHRRETVGSLGIRGLRYVCHM